MRIAFVCDVVFPYSKGGREKRLHDISQALIQQGHIIDIYTMKWWEGADNIERDGIHLHALCRNYRLYVGKHRSLKQALLFGLSCLKLINKDFDVVDVDQIPIFPIYSMWLVCLLKQKKLFVTWHEVWDKKYWKTYLKKLAFIANLLEKLGAHIPMYITAVSEVTASELKTQLNREKGVLVIPNAVNFAAIAAVSPAKTKQDIIFAARLLDHKHAELLVLAVAQLKATHPNISCLIIGTGPEEIMLKQLVFTMRLEKNIIFQDFFDDINDLYAAIKASKVYALPSEREGFGIGLLEANACGIPAVTVNMPHNTARLLIKKNKNGSIAKLTAASLAASLEYWLRRTNKDIQKIVQSYDWKFMIEKLEEQYSQ